MQICIRDVMTSELTTVSCDSTIEEIETLMLDENRRCVPVVDGVGDCVGVLSHSDILRVRYEKKNVAEVLVHEVMTRKLVSVSPRCCVDDVISLMGESGLHHILVLANRKVHGIVSIFDIIKLEKARTYNPFAAFESGASAG